MAGIDKIYGTTEQWSELFYWLAEHRPQYCRFLYTPFWTEPVGPISNFPMYADKWLYRHCELKWVKERIKDQYNGSPLRKR